MRSFILGLLCTLAIVARGGTASDLGDDPATFDQQIDTAYLKHDVAFMAAVMADDVRFTHSGGDVWTKLQSLDAARSHNDLERNVDSVDVERHGDVIETFGHIQVKTPNQDRPEYHVYYVRLYARRERGWQLLSHRTVRQVTGPLSPASQSETRTTSVGRGSGFRDVPETIFPDVYRPGNGVTFPRVLHEVRPQYTSDAMRANVQGGVLLACVVRPDGSVGDVHVVRSLDPTFGLDQEAIKSAKQWRFVPGTRQGEPVAVAITIEMTFTLGKPD
jgi:TonB family protein